MNSHTGIHNNLTITGSSKMTANNDGARFQRSGGFSLVELMVASTLGLILLTGVVFIFLGARQTNDVSSNAGTIQNDGRFLLQFMKEDVQHAGYLSWEDFADLVPAGATMEQHILFAGDAVQSGWVADFTPTQNNVAVGSAEDSDILTIQQHALVDCLGDAPIAPLDASGNGLVVNTYQLIEGAGGVTELACNGQPLVRNVESFQVLYGVEQEGIGLQYYNAADLPPIARSLVSSIQIGFVITSADEVSDVRTRTIPAVLDEAAYDKDDRLIRRVFSETIYIPNRNKDF